MEGEFMTLFSIRITNKEKKKAKYFCCMHSNWMTIDDFFCRDYSLSWISWYIKEPWQVSLV
jgi:hypothetical protein